MAVRREVRAKRSASLQQLDETGRRPCGNVISNLFQPLARNELQAPKADDTLVPMSKTLDDSRDATGQ